MNIGATIKRMRKERNMTQENLAEALEISVSAVSQWEVGKTLPDITTLSALASVLNVSADELLGTETERIRHIVAQRTQQAVQLQNEGKFDELLTLAEQTYMQYPHNLKAMGMYAWILQTTADSDHPERWDHSIRLSERILERSDDEQERVSSIYRICKCYAKKGDKVNAYRYAVQLPTHMAMNTAYVICHYELEDHPITEQASKQIFSLFGMLKCFAKGVLRDKHLDKAQKQQLFKKIKDKAQRLSQDLSLMEKEWKENETR